MMRYWKMGSAVMAICAVSACGNKEAASTAATPATTPPLASKTGANADAARALEQAKQAQKPLRQPDRGVPLENYTALDDGDRSTSWLTYVAISKDDQKRSDEELLNLFSARYFNEADAFKKRELMPQELPKVKDLLQKYKAQDYYSKRFGFASDPISQLEFITSPYNFDTKSFAVGNSNCFNSGFQNQQRVQISFKTEERLCRLVVEDTNLAKTVEELRSRNSANLTGTVYFYVSKVENGMVEAVVTHVHYDVSDKPSYLKGGKVVASVKI